MSNQRDPDKSDISDPQVEPIQKKEIGGPKGPEPTRYGDWEKNGRCSDF
ncbi:MAG: DUF1674 domain-containing protein [Gammaproteobacteria bacterium]|nr:DUF1674 domain-containing protein [Gammaproteobacteria bacterium]